MSKAHLGEGSGQLHQHHFDGVTPAFIIAALRTRRCFCPVPPRRIERTPDSSIPGSECTKCCTHEYSSMKLYAVRKRLKLQHISI